MQHYRQKWGTKRFVLAGYSFGADVLPAIYNRLPTEDQQRVDAVVLLAFARSGSFEIEVRRMAGQGRPGGPHRTGDGQAAGVQGGVRVRGSRKPTRVAAPTRPQWVNG